VEAAPRGYLLCVFDDNGNKSALYLDSELKNTDSIDKKILAVRAAITSADVSVNGRFIYVVPDYGDPIYDAKNKIYIPDPAKAKITNNAISSAIAKSNIDLSRFTVINTGTQ
jgi:hypothetical protein